MRMFRSPAPVVVCAASSARRAWLVRRAGLIAGSVLAVLIGNASFSMVPAQAEPLKTENLSAMSGGKKKYPEFDEARKLLAKSDTDGALEVLNAAAAAHSELPNGRVLLAQIYFTANRVRDGRAMMEKAVIELPDDPEPFIFMAEQANREGQWTVATMTADKAVTLATNFKGDAERKKDLLKRALMASGNAARGREDWEQARKQFAAAVKTAPQDAAVHFQLGQVLFELKKDKEAYAELQAAARVDEDIPSPDALMGHLWDKADDRTKAESWMKKAVSSDGKRLKTRLDVAQWYLKYARLIEAKQQIDEALALDPDSHEALYLAGKIARLQKDYPLARKYLEKSYLALPANVPVSNELAMSLSELGEEERQRALVIAQLAFNLNKNNPESAATLGWILYRLGRYDEAEQLVNHVIGTGQLTPDSAYFIAAIADVRNRGEMGKPLLEAALKMESPFAYREEAQSLYDRLKSATPAAGGKDAKDGKDAKKDTAKTPQATPKATPKGTPTSTTPSTTPPAGAKAAPPKADAAPKATP